MSLWQNTKVMRWLTSWIMLCTFALAVAAATLWIVQRPFFSIVRVDVTVAPGFSLNQFDQSALSTVHLGPVGGGFFRVDLVGIKRRFEAAPWVRQAHVRRIWPNKVLVEIEEHQAVAIWEDGRLVNSYGELFTANAAALENESQLTRLSGPDGTHTEVVRRWRELNDWIKPLGRTVAELTLSDRHAWTVELDSGMVVLMGRDQGSQIKERVQRMVQVLPEVNQRIGRQVEQIDLRHPEGFALKPVIEVDPPTKVDKQV
jgi:cell division protein FtsQ